MTTEKQTNEEMCADAEVIVKELRTAANEVEDAYRRVRNIYDYPPHKRDELVRQLKQAIKPYEFLIG